MDIDALKRLLNDAVDQWAAGASPNTPGEITVVENNTHIPSEGKRAVRTKSSGDRVYLLNEKQKTRQWLTNPAVLKDQGFESGDVVEVEDSEVLKYQLGAAIYRVENDKSEA